MNHINILVILALSLSVLQILIRGVFLFIGKTIPENFSRIFGTSIVTTQLALFFVANILYFWGNVPSQEINLPLWFGIDSYKFESTLLIDKYALIHSLLTTALIALVLKYSFQYLHREKGHNRFFFLISVLSFGLSFISFSGSFDTLFIGWELIGISSVLLIAFFNTNIRSVQNSFRTLVFYRLSDAAMLMASALLHHNFHSNIFSHFHSGQLHDTSILIGFLILFASLAKSAQMPFISWLPRAMEGPTSSSAVYYGALSVHLGPFLLLRTADVWSIYPVVRYAMMANGLLTFLVATYSGRTKTDIKSQLGFYTIAQIGLIYIELAFGWYDLVLFHIVVHAIYRTMSFLRSSSWIQDVQENQELFNLAKIKIQKTTQNKYMLKLHHFAQHSFYLDYFHQHVVVNPILGFFRKLLMVRNRIPYLPVLVYCMAIISVFWMHYNHVDKIKYISIICLFASFYHAGVSIASQSFKESLNHLLLSFLGLMAIFCIEYITHLPIVVLVCIVSLSLYACLFWIQTLISKIYPNLKLTEYLGLTHENKEISTLFFLSGMVLVGLPGGLYFIVEDLVFHTLLEYSAFATFGFIILTVFNAMSFYRLFTCLFLGPVREQAQLNYKKYQVVPFYIIVVVAFIFGIMPALYLQF